MSAASWYFGRGFEPCEAIGAESPVRQGLTPGPFRWNERQFVSAKLTVASQACCAVQHPANDSPQRYNSSRGVARQLCQPLPGSGPLKESFD